MRRWQGPTPERIAVVIEVKAPGTGNYRHLKREQLAKRYGVVSLCASAAGWVQMRCRECAAEVAVTARVCSGCGAPIVGQPPVVADTVVAARWWLTRWWLTRWWPRSATPRGRLYLPGWPGRSTVQPGPVTPLDEKVSGATLVEWAAWAASTTFSSTGLGFGCDKREVNAFRSAVRDTFLGGAVFWVSTPPVKSDDVRGKLFSTHWPGYDKKQVAAFLDAAGIRLAAMESTDRPSGPLVSDAILVAWAEWADSTTFGRMSGYTVTEVDAFREKIRDTFLGARRSPVRADKVRGKQFSTDDDGYDKKQVAAFLDAAGIRLAAMESTDRPSGPLVSVAILVAWADSTRFSTSRLRVGRYDTAEVDAFREAIRDTFLGVRRSPLTWRAPPGKQFTTTRRLRPGYDPEEVDAFLDKAEPRLAAVRAADKGAT